MVLHDPIVLFDPMLFRRQDVAALRPGTSRNPAYLDLSQRAPGLGLEMDLAEPVTVTLQRPGRREGEPVETAAIRFTPTRPGAVVEEATRRRIGSSRRRPVTE